MSELRIVEPLCPAWCVEEHTAEEIAQAGAIVCMSRFHEVRSDDLGVVKLQLARSDSEGIVEVYVDDRIYTVTEALELVGMVAALVGEAVR